MAKAAISSQSAALYSLAIIQFNRKGGTKKDKDFKAGEDLCARLAFLGHVNTLRESLATARTVTALPRTWPKEGAFSSRPMLGSSPQSRTPITSEHIKIHGSSLLNHGSRT